MTVFSLSGSFTPADTMRHFYYPFRLEKDFKELRVFYSYSPKIYGDEEDTRRQIEDCYRRYGFLPDEREIAEASPLNNLIPLSVDSPDGCLGCAHRHANSAEYFISESRASSGFMPAKIKSGIWTLSLSTHSVLSAEVRFWLRVEAYD